MMQPEKTFNNTARSLVEQAATIFDQPTFLVVCPQCQAATRLEDAVDKDRGGDSDPCGMIDVVCPRCKLRVTL